MDHLCITALKRLAPDSIKGLNLVQLDPREEEEWRNVELNNKNALFACQPVISLKRAWLHLPAAGLGRDFFVSKLLHESQKAAACSSAAQMNISI
jgi:hypothetical protein